MERSLLNCRFPDVETGKQYYEPTDGKSVTLENEASNKRRRTDLYERPSLMQLCVHQATLILPQLAHQLRFIPNDLVVTLLQGFLRRFPAPSLSELKFVCEASWNPQNLSLCGVQPINSRGVQCISILPNLVRLDLRGWSWLMNLDFLPGLNCLECLVLRNCVHLPPEALLYIRELPQLQCLDVENVSAMTDNLATYIVSGLTRLRALNIGYTCIGDSLVEVLTYGCRLHTWASHQDETRVEDIKLVTESGHHGVETLLRQYPVSSLVYWRLQSTQITDVAVAHLLAIPDLQLLDVRLTNATGRSLFALKAMRKLIALPNNAKLAARTNAMLAGVLEGDCGCRAMARQSKASNSDAVTDELDALWQQAFVQLLQRASSETPQ
ncbi:uncharacterized protein [Physcomitrium patens]|uniref:F-box domain-containing protein n=2 Tax=Physcomitrium patens TaxID=3218 RepID=A0A2K1L7F9_PHYPA|nr:uncharacterized protein LOC112285951 isoform X1 [Physcomitrium patens]PNR61921.1 hypothetical protein PHYPA_000345 [Physcomitrium patens]|eukprot:XP_024383144.1 uncharacterized protein LOC112285951 isoform X1 [Physcomitrella patens]